MKKYLLIVIAMLTVLFCFAACGKNINIITDPSAYSEYASKSLVEASVSESKQAEEIKEDITKTEKSLGSSVENEKLVLKKNDDSNASVYEVWYFGNTGKATYKEAYYYCDDAGTYDYWIETLTNSGANITKSDENLRVIVVRYDDVMQLSYGTLYNKYVDKDSYEIM